MITTVIDKFEAVTKAKLKLDSPDIFVLVDESHRGQYDVLHTNMRRVLPKACFIGFTGTPVAKGQKNTIAKFGGLIPPVYTINDAVADAAVVPLLYEGRDVPQMVDGEQIDRWFDRITATLTKDQAADLKRKFSSTSQLNKAEQKVAAIAWDVSAHFVNSGWKGVFKGQLVAPDKATALRYKKHFDECALVTTEVLISAPDDREGDDDVHKENKLEVVKFWRSMVGNSGRFKDEADYNKILIQRFKYGEEPDIIIVVDKLLTGFDAPRNIVLYLTRRLKEHTLLQAIARVNRVWEGKDYGYVIDYAGVLHGLSEALDIYGSLAGFDREDLDGMLIDVSAETARLPQLHSELWGVFAVQPTRPGGVRASTRRRGSARRVLSGALRVRAHVGGGAGERAVHGGDARGEGPQVPRRPAFLRGAAALGASPLRRGDRLWRVRAEDPAPPRPARGDR